eukprot:6437306-Prymnesium_polylepis.1
MGTCWMDRVGCLESVRSRSSRSTRPHAVHCYRRRRARSSSHPAHSGARDSSRGATKCRD